MLYFLRFCAIFFFLSWAFLAKASGPVVYKDGAFFQTPHDRIPIFYANPTIYSIKSGNWSNPSTWSQGRIPRTDDIVLIKAGHLVSYDQVNDSVLAVLGIEGKLSFRPDINTELRVATVEVAPEATLEIGTKLVPIKKDITAKLYLGGRPIATTAPDPVSGILDPFQFGNALIGLGNLSIYGAAQTLAYTRLTSDALAGASMLSCAVDLSSSWKAGDQIVLPDTRSFPYDFDGRLIQYEKEGKHLSQTETATIASISRNVITLTKPLLYNHKGAYMPDLSPVKSKDGTVLKPVIANLNRNIIIQSLSKDPNLRAHILISGDASLMQIAYAKFVDLGRTRVDGTNISTATVNQGQVLFSTNQVGRYWLHIHHFYGKARTLPQGLTGAQIRDWLKTNGYQFEILGNVLASSDLNDNHKARWGITIHDTSHGLIANNVLMNMAGSGIMTEEANESYNSFLGNYIVKVQGLGRTRIGPGNVAKEQGADGSGMWFRGTHNFVENNFVADVDFAGYQYNGYYRTPEKARVPLFPGANTHEDSEITAMEIMPILSFKNNEFMGAGPIGFWGSWMSSTQLRNWPENLIENFIAWNAYTSGIEGYHNGKTRFLSPIIVNDYQTEKLTPKEFGFRAGIDLSNYENLENTIDSALVAGYNIGLNVVAVNRQESFLSPILDQVHVPLIIRNSIFENFVNILATTPGTADRDVYLSRNNFVRSPAISDRGKALLLEENTLPTIAVPKQINYLLKSGLNSNSNKSDYNLITNIAIIDHNLESALDWTLSYTENPKTAACVKDLGYRLAGPNCCTWDIEDGKTDRCFWGNLRDQSSLDWLLNSTAPTSTLIATSPYSTATAHIAGKPQSSRSPTPTPTPSPVIPSCSNQIQGIKDALQSPATTLETIRAIVGL